MNHLTTFHFQNISKFINRTYFINVNIFKSDHHLIAYPHYHYEYTITYYVYHNMLLR